MTRHPVDRLLPILFFLSGVAGLVYEIVWIRMLVLVFGNTTHSIVAVVSIFFAGLAIGSLVLGRKSDSLSAPSLLRLYSRLEIGIGLAALFSIPILSSLGSFYSLFSDGITVTASLLLVKFALTAATLLIPTILMGATFPTVVSFAQIRYEDSAKNVSILYAVNTFGAIVGVLFSGFLLIELIGLDGTLLVAVSLNILVGVFANFLGVEDEAQIRGLGNNPLPIQTTSRDIVILIAYTVSGLTAIAYQLLWTRMLTPRVGTFIYAFAGILAIYLFGIALGSWIYNRFLAKNPLRGLLFSMCQLGMGVSALGSIYLLSTYFDVSYHLAVLGSVFPATVFMGICFPAVVLMMNGNGGIGSNVGFAYASNTLGSILGGFIASFVMIPIMGSTRSIMLLAMVNLFLALVFFWTEGRRLSIGFLRFVMVSIISMILLVAVSLKTESSNLNERVTQERLNWLKGHGIDHKFNEDEVASVLAYHDANNGDQQLFIDGIATTTKILETKLMAHLPLAVHPSPKSVLVIAFGMGTTFRSALMHNVNVDAIELCPSVPKMFSLFYPDAGEVMKNPRGRVIINDGRNYVCLTRKQYDIVTIDPPPPFNGAGTTVLYAKEFYEHIVRKLNTGGIVCQWMLLESREDDIAMATKSFLEVFPHVRAFRSVGLTKGMFLLGSLSFIELNEGRLDTVFRSTFVKNDFAEVGSFVTPDDVRRSSVGDRDKLYEAVGHFPAVTDNFPRTEYFLLRHSLSEYPPMSIARLFNRPYSK